jgi:DNA-binding transcriptional regulator GbsR (MarR family)
MASLEQLKQKVLNETRQTNRLRLATTRLHNAQQEHVWAIAAANSEGLSIRKIAAATGLSSSRVHQVLHTEEALQIPEWLNSRTDSQANTDEPPISQEMQSLQPFQQRLAEETKSCIGALVG